MRLTSEEIEAIRDCAKRRFGERCVIRLFGSRADDNRRGGDIDLHIVAQSAENGHSSQRTRVPTGTQAPQGEQKIDVIVRPPDYAQRGIDLIAAQNGIPLP